MKPSVILPLIFSLLCAGLAGCEEAPLPPEVEGDEPGECADGTDNDQDGAADCDDEGCAVDAACTGDDDDTADDDDSAGDDDDSAGDDDDSAGDDDDSAGDDDDSASSGEHCIDSDEDGFCLEVDCDDNTAAINPDAAETCDDVDNNCNGQVDEDAIDTESFYLDADNDGYGAAHLSREGCEAPAGFVPNSLDCDDLSAAVYPGATEVCDEQDNDCDTLIDEEDAAPPTWYSDFDGDSFGNPTNSVTACLAPPSYISESTDCDDLDASTYPGATEICDGTDNNCDLSIDEGVTTTFFGDSDGDGYGDSGDPVQACFQPPGASSNQLDCDDSQPSAHPGGIELCDGIDNDCDSSVDDSPLDAGTWYTDADIDGFGNIATGTTACTQIPGTVGNGLDCDDGNVAAFPGNPEVCDGADNNCNSATDESFDEDGDNVTTCGPDGDPATTADNDCDDNAATGPGNFPGNNESCDGADNNCNGLLDDGFDLDIDGVTTCGLDGNPATTGDNDCDDTEDQSYPGNMEICDGIDNDCSGSADDGGDALGGGALCPATSCLAIRDGRTTTPTDGLYFLDPDGDSAGIFETWCDMTTDAGGWTLLGTIFGGDANNWNVQHGPWSSTSPLGAATAPFEDFKSPAWYELDITNAEILWQRRYAGTVRASAVLGNSCQGGKTRFNELFTTWDTSISCGAGQITVQPSVDGTGNYYPEGSTYGLSGSGTNGWCWNGGDTHSNTFQGHAGWNQSAYGCYGNGHLGYIGVFSNGSSQYNNLDIDNTNWQHSIDATQTAVSFFARD